MPKTKDIKSTKPNELTQASEQNTTQTNSIREFFYEQTYVRVLVRDGRALKRIAYAEGGLYVISISLFFSLTFIVDIFIHTNTQQNSLIPELKPFGVSVLFFIG